MTIKRSLKGGRFGEKLVDYFHKELGITAVDAECLNPEDADGSDQLQYRITFDDETVADYLITFSAFYSLDIVSAEEYNRVI